MKEFSYHLHLVGFLTSQDDGELNCAALIEFCKINKKFSYYSLLGIYPGAYYCKSTYFDCGRMCMKNLMQLQCMGKSYNLLVYFN